MDPFSLIVVFFTILLSLFCLVGNSLTIVAVSKDTSLKKSVTNYCVVSLAIADIIVGAIIIPFRGFYEFNQRKWIFGYLLCDIWYATNISTCTASILNLCLISLDRYVSIFDTLNYDSRLSRKKVVIYIFLIWIISILISFPAMIRSWIMGLNDDSNLSDRCMLFLSEKSYMMMICALTFYIPLIFMTYVYVKIYFKASEQIKFMRSGTKVTNEISLRIHSSRKLDNYNEGFALERGDRGKKSNRGETTDQGKRIDQRKCIRAKGNVFQRRWISREDKAAKTLGIVFGAFLICWLPFFIKFPIYMFTDTAGQPDLLLTLFNWFGWFNSCLNPVIYWFWSRDFRRAFKRIAVDVTKTLFHHDTGNDVI